MKIIIASILILTIFLNAAHPVHISVTNIEYIQKSRNFKASIRLFIDDFEQAIYNKYKVNLLLGKENQLNKADFYINKYCKNNLQIIFNGNNNVSNKMTITSTKLNLKENTITIYYKIKEKEPQKVSIKNTLLNDLYKDQKNLLIFTCKNTQEAIKFDFSKTYKEFTIK